MVQAYVGHHDNASYFDGSQLSANMSTDDFHDQ